MTKLRIRSPHIMVVASPAGTQQHTAPDSGVRLGGDYDDFALLASRLCDATAAVVLLGGGEETRVAGSHGWGGHHDTVGLSCTDLGGRNLSILSAVHLTDPDGKTVASLLVLDAVRRVLTPTQRHDLETLTRQMMVFFELRHQNATDPLTGLANRRVFELRLAEEVERSRRYGTPLSLLMIDVDDFKGYNDAFGHPAGDDVLRRLAWLLSESVRTSDLVARYGGEEFAVIVPEGDIYGALFLAERCRHTIEVVHWLHRGVTVSVGVASMPPCQKDGGDLLAAADQALYRAKRRGGNRTAKTPDAWSKTDR